MGGGGGGGEQGANGPPSNNSQVRTRRVHTVDESGKEHRKLVMPAKEIF